VHGEKRKVSKQITPRSIYGQMQACFRRAGSSATADTCIQGIRPNPAPPLSATTIHNALDSLVENGLTTGGEPTKEPSALYPSIPSQT